MTQDELTRPIEQRLPHKPTREQAAASAVFGLFLADHSPRAVMVMRGSAGTGKTTLAAAWVKTLRALGQKVVLLAPTGRAAKVLSLSCGVPASTIHRHIYRQRTFTGLPGGFELNDNLHADTLFIVDEASMIAGNVQSGPDAFGSGCLLDDLIIYIYSGRNCRLLLIGDVAQLPPVGEEEAPALQASQLQSRGLSVHECTLNEVMRQAQESGILSNATTIRRAITRDAVTQLPRIRLTGFADIHVVPGNELIEQLNSSYASVGIDETIVVTRSNKRANIYNMGIRNSILDREELLCTGDQLMVVKNNYHWLAATGTPAPAASLAFLANGDRCEVMRVRNIHDLYGFRFADVWLRFPDYDDFELHATALLDSLTSDAPALTRQQSDQLFNSVMEDYADIPRKADRLRAVKEDKYFNALQVKYAYAVTCHKAQGGQWEHVYLDQGYMTDDWLTPDYLHWLYTAFTRATRHLYLVNWPATQIDEST